MDDNDIKKIEKIISDRRVASETLIRKRSKVYKLFQELNDATFLDGSLTVMQKELIALGISIIINCESCMQHHTEKAINAGATEDQVIETIEVAIEMGGGPATVSARFALKVLDYYLKR